MVTIGSVTAAREWLPGPLVPLSATILVLLLIPNIRPLIQRSSKLLSLSRNEDEDIKTDPSILKKHSTYQSFTVPSSGFTYSSLRIYYHAHTQADKLPTQPKPLPLLVFIHGLGGSAAQWAPLLTSLINVGPCLCVDLPGCGLSAFEPHQRDAYSRDALVELLVEVIDTYRDTKSDQGLVLIGHSLGTNLCAALAADGSRIAAHVLGLIALCPHISPISAHHQKLLARLASMPSSLLDLIRAWDRRGGSQSASVRRIAGEDADEETRKLQLRYNRQSKTPVWQRMVYGGILHVTEPPTQLWARVNVPTYLIGGEADTVTPAAEVHDLAALLRSRDHAHAPTKTSILPAPASHALLYAPGQCRILSGLLQSWLAQHIDGRLSLGWQLQYLSKEGKWDVKNYEKWRRVTSVSGPIGHTFRAMKTMRQVDDAHNPRRFAGEWRGRIRAVVDISHEAPVYDPQSLEEGGIAYYKFPTVSKLPPSVEEVTAFNELIDRLRGYKMVQGPNGDDELKEDDGAHIAVHCHYGFNRTGFFIVCYLVDRMGWRLQDAIDEFARGRPPGIKHDYFVDELFVRYCIGLRRSSTA